MKTNFKPIEYDPRYTKRGAKNAFNKNIARALVELITNSIDSYKRLHNPGINTIKILYSKSGKKYYVRITDFAEGVNVTPSDGSHPLSQILKMGAATSGSIQGKKIRGHHGVGLKDVGLAMDNTLITTIRNNKLSQCKILWKDKVGGVEYLKEDEKVTPGDRKKLDILENGFVVEFEIPNDFISVSFEKLKEQLESNYFLRRIFERKEFKIVLYDDLRNKNEILNYSPPQGEVLEENEFLFKFHNFGKFLIRYTIKKSKTELSQTGFDRRGGLIIFHDEDAVLDCQLFGFDREHFAEKLFGDVEISGDNLPLLLEEEDIVDEKRRGLIKENPFVEELNKKMNEVLKVYVDKEREEASKNKKVISLSNVSNISAEIRKLNDLAKAELEDFVDIDIPPGWTPPTGLGFYPSVKKLIILEGEIRKIFLVGVKKILPTNKIVIISSSDDINVTPKIIDLNSLKEKGGIVHQKIIIESLHKGAKGKIEAKCLDYEEYKDEIEVEVISNPKLNPKGGIEFVPNQHRIGDNKLTKIPLIVSKELFDREKIINLSSNDENITLHDDIIILKESHKSIGQKVYEVDVSITGKGVGKSGIITAIIAENKTECGIEVIDPITRGAKGFFEDITLDEFYDGKEVSRFEDKIVYVHTEHPILSNIRLSKDLSNEITDNEGFLILIADILTQRICWEITFEKFKPGGTRYAMMDPDNAFDEYTLTFEELYFRLGPKLQRICMLILKKYKNKPEF